MSYKFTKTHIEHFEITDVFTNFMKYGVFSRVRKDKSNCELCKKKFNQEDNTNLAFVVGKKNHLICDSCTDEAIQGGAREVTEEERSGHAARNVAKE